MVNFVVNEKRSRDKYFRYTFANKLPNNGVFNSAKARWRERERKEKGIRTWDSGCWEWRLIGASKPSEWNSLFHGRYSPAFASPDPLSSPVSSPRFRFRPGYSPRSRRNSTAVETLRPTLPPCTCYVCDGTEPPRLIWLNWKIKRLLFRGDKLSRRIAAHEI